MGPGLWGGSVPSRRPTTHSAGTIEKASTVNWSMATMKSVNTSGHSTREKLRRVERHCTRPTTILKMAEICLGVLGGSRDSSRASGGQQPPRRACAPVELAVAVRR